jgi:hypothetical protein
MTDETSNYILDSTLHHHTAGINAVSISGDGEKLLSGGTSIAYLLKSSSNILLCR